MESFARSMRVFFSFLFVFYGIDWIGEGGSDSFKADNEKSDKKGRKAGEDKDPDANVCPVGVILQPFIHEEISNGPGNRIGD